MAVVVGGVSVSAEVGGAVGETGAPTVAGGTASDGRLALVLDFFALFFFSVAGFASSTKSCCCVQLSSVVLASFLYGIYTQFVI